MRHQVSRAMPMSAAMNGHSRVVPSHHASRTGGGQLRRPRRGRRPSRARSPSRYARAQVIAPGRLSPANVPPGIGKYDERLPVRVHAAQRVGIVVERVRAARAGVEQHPDEAAVVLAAPADVVEHHRLVQPLREQQALQQLHRDRRCPGRLRWRVAIVSPFVSGPARGVEEAFGEVGRRPRADEAELVLPAEAVGLNSREHVEHRAGSRGAARASRPR